MKSYSGKTRAGMKIKGGFNAFLEHVKGNEIYEMI